MWLFQSIINHDSHKARHRKKHGDILDVAQTIVCNEFHRVLKFIALTVQTHANP